MPLKKPIRVEVLVEALNEVKALRLEKQFAKQKNLFILNQSHYSLDFKPLKGKVKGIFSFRINQKYRARLVKSDKSTYQIFQVGDFH